MSALFTPIKLRGLNLANRIMVAPMCQYSSVDGEVNDWHFTGRDYRVPPKLLAPSPLPTGGAPCPASC